MGNVYAHHWSGIFFHLECMPEEERLHDKAKAALGKKPENVTDGTWLLMLKEKQRSIMVGQFPTRKTGECAECIERSLENASSESKAQQS